jgi:hypothetical protein
MKEESWRDPKILNLIASGGGSKPRYKLSEITGVKESYRANPGGTAGLGQLVFALNGTTAFTVVGCCVTGDCLIPWGICCSFAVGQSSACSACNCVNTGFCIGSSSTLYMALGTMNGCGATLFRRIV